jgi:hypothetical protein
MNLTSQRIISSLDYKKIQPILWKFLLLITQNPFEVNLTIVGVKIWYDYK